MSGKDRNNFLCAEIVKVQGYLDVLILRAFEVDVTNKAPLAIDFLNTPSLKSTVRC